MIKINQLEITVDGSRNKNERHRLNLGGIVDLGNLKIRLSSGKSYAIYGLYNPSLWYVHVSGIQTPIHNRVVKAISEMLDLIPESRIKTEYLLNRIEWLTESMKAYSVNYQNQINDIQSELRSLLDNSDYKFETAVVNGDYEQIADVQQNYNGFEIQTVTMNMKSGQQIVLKFDLKEHHRLAGLHNNILVLTRATNSIPIFKYPEYSIVEWSIEKDSNSIPFGQNLNIDNKLHPQYGQAVRLVAKTSDDNEIHFIIINNGMVQLPAVIRVNNTDYNIWL